MRLRNIYRLFYILLGIFGILMQFGVFAGNFNAWVLNYYTVLSNLLCIVYCALRMGYENRWLADGKMRELVMSPLTKYTVTMCITLTFLVYHFMLVPVWGMTWDLSLSSIGNYAVHYIIPVLTIADFLFLDRGDSPVAWYAPFWWIMVPLAYFAYILLRAPIFGNIGTTPSPYPYPFIDFTVYPVSQILLNIVVIIVVFVVVGYLLLLAHYLIKKGKKNA
ncbi:Pr6Pr family membrane protein [Dysgonomonas sp. 511]|uniref:Pr6Pr family membrane protein n=1 Tax=Dysgonomonas sp. 511 TaxID=2302930 RepID=UPI0013D32B83|nr:Pr6Pr family membrane protein [Dysgonomonas sp. 511]NDV78024.1 hypothetical protein [Dysgonomonas sp. 511]